MAFAFVCYDCSHSGRSEGARACWTVASGWSLVDIHPAHSWRTSTTYDIVLEEGEEHLVRLEMERQDLRWRSLTYRSRDSDFEVWTMELS